MVLSKSKRCQKRRGDDSQEEPYLALWLQTALLNQREHVVPQSRNEEQRTQLPKAQKDGQYRMITMNDERQGEGEESREGVRIGLDEVDEGQFLGEWKKKKIVSGTEGGSLAAG